jgi:hypothetical protein
MRYGRGSHEEIVQRMRGDGDKNYRVPSACKGDVR